MVLFYVNGYRHLFITKVMNQRGTKFPFDCDKPATVQFNHFLTRKIIQANINLIICDVELSLWVKHT